MGPLSPAAPARPAKEPVKDEIENPDREHEGGACDKKEKEQNRPHPCGHDAFPFRVSVVDIFVLPFQAGSYDSL